MERLAVTPALLLALLIAIAYSADRTALSSQVAHLSSRAAHLEAERDSLHSRVELMEQASKAPLAQPSAEAALPERRGLQTVPNDRATVRVDAPDGVSELILGGEAAADNVVLRKAHERDGAAFTLSRGDTQVVRVDPALLAERGAAAAAVHGIGDHEISMGPDFPTTWRRSLLWTRGD